MVCSGWWTTINGERFRIWDCQVTLRSYRCQTRWCTCLVVKYRISNRWQELRRSRFLRVEFLDWTQHQWEQEELHLVVLSILNFERYSLSEALQLTKWQVIFASSTTSQATHGRHYLPYKNRKNQSVLKSSIRNTFIVLAVFLIKKL